MSKRIVTLLIAFCFMTATATAGLEGTVAYGAQEEDAAIEGEYAEDEILVVFEDDVTKKAAKKAVAQQDGETMTVVDAPMDEMTAIVELPEGQSVQEAVSEYEKNANVAYAQPNYRYHLIDEEGTDSAQTQAAGEETGTTAQTQAAATVSLNDPWASELWHLDMVDAQDAWDLLKGIVHSKVRVAILDTGVDVDHEDLQGNLNQSLCVDVTGERIKSQTEDDDGHGTHVAGIIAAEANNGKGVAGVASGGSSSDSVVELFAVDVFPEKDEAYTDDIIRGMEYATANGAKVINMSLGYECTQKSREDTLLESAVNTVTASNVAVICAAGNDSNDVPNYPADFDACISVTSVNKAGSLSNFSNYGSAKDIAAPGGQAGTTAGETERIASTWPDNRYAGAAGTSMATPVVSGVAALLYSMNPDMTLNALKYILYETADSGVSDSSRYFGHGIVNAYNAIAKAQNRVTGISLNKTSARLLPGQVAKLVAGITPASALNNSVTWSSSDPSVAAVDGSGQVTAKKPGTAVITVRSNDLNGSVYTNCQVTVEYWVNYKLNGGKNHKSNPTSYYGRTVTLKDPTRSGYAFQGWYTDSNYLTRIKSFSKGNYTLYAKWKKVTTGKASIKRLKQKSATKMKVRQSKVSGAKGYQITYSTSKKFTKKTTKNKNVKGTSATLKNLKRGKTYYVKARAYKKDSAGKKVYGAYSKVKKLKMKK